MVIRLLSIAAALGLVSAAGAQTPGPTPDSLGPGAHVRAVLSPDSATVDRYLGIVRNDSLLTVSCRSCRDTLSAPFQSLLALNVERRRPNVHVGTTVADMLLGAVGGAALGAVVGAGIAYHDTHQPDCGDLCGLSWLAVPILGTVGGGAGLITGGVIGVTRRESYWVRVNIPITTK
jgi:hypothetical protein